MAQRTPQRLVLATTVLLLAAGNAAARPAHKQALVDYFGPTLAKKLNSCTTCHLPDPPGQKADPLDSDKPHNAFGARLKAVRQELRRAGKPTTIADRLDAIANEDSDGDGVSNLVELLTGHLPGDPQDRPTAAELAQVDAALTAFRKFRSAYPWRPFEVVHRPPVPAVKNTAWGRNPIDSFIAAEHEAQGLRPRPEAPRHVLLRRVYLDLIGLPPTTAELHAFLSDPSTDAYEKVVDRLLDDPRYGERWGRHWMDVWRYSDWAGYGPQVRDSQPHIWRWRDWIIESLNADKGYDRMILEMLAADELTPDDPQALRATGYLVRNFKLLSREKWMQDTVEHTAQAFLGITLGCARCHDHMFDPLTQKDYYQFRAIFEPYEVRTDRLPGQPDVKKDGLVRVYDAKPETPTYLFVRGDDRAPDKSHSLPAAAPEALGGKPLAVQLVSLPRTAYVPDRRPFIVQETLAQLEQAAALRRREAAAAAHRTWLAHLAFQPAHGPLGAVARLGLQARLEANRQAAQLALAAADEAVRKERLHVAFDRLDEAGQARSPAGLVAAVALTASERRLAVLKARHTVLTLAEGLAPRMPKAKVTPQQQLAEARKTLAKAEADLKRPPSAEPPKRQEPTYPATSTGRRLALARWLADRDNPLTARVAVNHIWLRHFGQALVPSVFDFGRNGRAPSHPALVDWLAAEFMDRGWSLKALHRLIVTSTTYRLDSTPDAEDLTRDNDNKYLWRMAPRRVEAEVVRDSVFYVAGRLDPAMGGPDIDQQLGLTVPRRSLYFRSASEKQMAFLKLFDGPSVSECYERKHSIMPQQALALANSELTRTHARVLARALTAQVGPSPEAFTTAAFEAVLSRPATPTERQECVSFLQQQPQRYPNGGNAAASDPALRARESLIHVLLNHHEFVTVR
jgi:hypothetical protein